MLAFEKNTAQVAAMEEQNTTQETPELWHRQENEPILWYKRFQTYYLLGPKRSLQHALELGGEKVQVLKGPKKEEREQTKERTKGPLKEVKPVVPGSWKRASVSWHWQERAKAWDEHFILTQAESLYKKLTEANKYTLACERIEQLAWMYRTAKSQLTGNLTHTDLQKYLVRMDTILLRIREESQLIDEEVTKHVLAARKREHYEHLSLTEYLEIMTRSADKELKKRG